MSVKKLIIPTGSTKFDDLGVIISSEKHALSSIGEK